MSAFRTVGQSLHGMLEGFWSRSQALWEHVPKVSRSRLHPSVKHDVPIDGAAILLHEHASAMVPGPTYVPHAPAESYSISFYFQHFRWRTCGDPSTDLSLCFLAPRFHPVVVRQLPPWPLPAFCLRIPASQWTAGLEKFQPLASNISLQLFCPVSGGHIARWLRNVGEAKHGGNACPVLQWAVQEPS